MDIKQLASSVEKEFNSLIKMSTRTYLLVVEDQNSGISEDMFQQASSLSLHLEKHMKKYIFKHLFDHFSGE